MLDFFDRTETCEVLSKIINNYLKIIIIIIIIEFQSIIVFRR